MRLIISLLLSGILLSSSVQAYDDNYFWPKDCWTEINGKQVRAPSDSCFEEWEKKYCAEGPGDELCPKEEQQ